MEQYPVDRNLMRDLNKTQKKELPPYVKWVLIALVVVLGLLTWYTHTLEEKRIEQAKEDGTLVYYMTSVPMYSFEDGKLHYMTEFYADGLPVVLNFWASWCEPCVEELEAFAEAKKKYGDSVRFVLISMIDGTTETVETAKAYIDSLDYDFNYFFNDSAKVAEDLHLEKIPTTLFLYGDSGYVATVQQGGLNAQQVTECIELTFERINGNMEATLPSAE